MRVLITGGAGYIGAVIGRKLVTAGHQISVLDDFSSGYLDSVSDGPIHHGSILDADLHPILQDVETVVHCAGKSLVAESVAKPELYRRVNVDGSRRLMRAMQEVGTPRILFSSSAAVYKSADHPLSESDKEQPSNPYGHSKLEVDRLLQKSGLMGVSFRYFNVAGSLKTPGGWSGERHHPETHLIPNLLQATSEKPFQLFGTDWPTPDGTCIRDYIHVEDLADAHLAALNHQSFDICNLGSGRGSSVREVLTTAEEALGRKFPTVSQGRRAGDPAILVAQYEKAEELFGWRPRLGLADMIKSAEAFIRLSSH